MNSYARIELRAEYASDIAFHDFCLINEEHKSYEEEHAEIKCEKLPKILANPSIGDIKKAISCFGQIEWRVLAAAWRSTCADKSRREALLGALLIPMLEAGFVSAADDYATKAMDVIQRATDFPALRSYE